MSAVLMKNLSCDQRQRFWELNPPLSNSGFYLLHPPSHSDVSLRPFLAFYKTTVFFQAGQFPLLPGLINSDTSSSTPLLKVQVRTAELCDALY